MYTQLFYSTMKIMEKIVKKNKNSYAIKCLLLIQTHSRCYYLEY